MLSTLSDGPSLFCTTHFFAMSFGCTALSIPASSLLPAYLLFFFVPYYVKYFNDTYFFFCSTLASISVRIPPKPQFFKPKICDRLLAEDLRSDGAFKKTPPPSREELFNKPIDIAFHIGHNRFPCIRFKAFMCCSMAIMAQAS